jgi:hypothetical protein
MQRRRKGTAGCLRPHRRLLPKECFAQYKAQAQVSLVSCFPVSAPAACRLIARRAPAAALWRCLAPPKPCCQFRPPVFAVQQAAPLTCMCGRCLSAITQEVTAAPNIFMFRILPGRQLCPLSTIGVFARIANGIISTVHWGSTLGLPQPLWRTGALPSCLAGQRAVQPRCLRAGAVAPWWRAGRPLGGPGALSCWGRCRTSA